MQAMVMHAPEAPRLEDVAQPVVGANDVLLRVAACGVCGSDIPRLLTKGGHHMPIIRGHEFSGHIVELGSGVAGFRPDELISVAPLIPCRACYQCLTVNFLRAAGITTNSAVAEMAPMPNTSPCRGETCSRRPMALILAPWRWSTRHRLRCMPYGRHR